jgi:hypothetical protein
MIGSEGDEQDDGTTGRGGGCTQNGPRGFFANRKGGVAGGYV